MSRFWDESQEELLELANEELYLELEEDDDFLSIVEAVAEDYGLYSSEESVSATFDEQVLSFVVAEFSEDDEAAISEAFSNWTDSLNTDGYLHSEQISQYNYVGRLA